MRPGGPCFFLSFPSREVSDELREHQLYHHKGGISINPTVFETRGNHPNIDEVPRRRGGWLLRLSESTATSTRSNAYL